MTIGRSTPATRLARPVNLGLSWNASDADVAGRFHPLYGQALERLPEGDSVLRGVPFKLGSRSAGKRWILVGDGLTVDLRRHSGGPGGDGPGQGHVRGRASHLLVAHFADSWRAASGERPAGMPVGWVLPTGEPLVRSELVFEGGYGYRASDQASMIGASACDSTANNAIASNNSDRLSLSISKKLRCDVHRAGGT